MRNIESILEEILEELKTQRYRDEDNIMNNFKKEIESIEFGSEPDFNLPNYIFKSERFREMFVEFMSEKLDYATSQIEKLNKKMLDMKNGPTILILNNIISSINNNSYYNPSTSKAIFPNIEENLDSIKENLKVLTFYKSFLESTVLKYASNEIILLLKLQNKM
jgi:hypothetical protein